MANIQTRVQNWVNQGIINSAQAQQIVNYEVDKKGASTIIGFYVLASFIISLGIVSLIAFNWEQIPVAVKLLLDFAVLIGLAIFCMYYLRENILRFEILLFFFLLLCMASIGLIGQIYNLNSPTYVALLLWAGMTAVAVINSERAFTWFVWLGALLAGIFLFYFDNNFTYETLVLTTLLMLNIALILLSKNYFQNDGCKMALNYWGLLGFITTIAFLDFDYYLQKVDPRLLVIPLGAFFIAIFAIWQSNLLIQIQKIIASAIVALIMLALTFNVYGVELAFLPAIQTVSILILSAILFASLHNITLFNMFIGFIVVRCLIFYFEALGGLATTGFGLIIAGAIILYSTAQWKKHGVELRNKIEGWINVKK